MKHVIGDNNMEWILKYDEQFASWLDSLKQSQASAVAKNLVLLKIMWQLAKIAT